MTLAPPPEHRLLRLCLVLKAAMWAAIALTLIIGIWDIASGRQAGLPIALLLSIPVLGILQGVAWVAWFRLWKARQRKDKR